MCFMGKQQANLADSAASLQLARVRSLSPPQYPEKSPYSSPFMAGVAKTEVSVDTIAIASTLSFLRDVAGIQQVRNYLPCRPLSDADGIGNSYGCGRVITSYAAQHQSMVGKKSPSRHITSPFYQMYTKNSHATMMVTTCILDELQFVMPIT